MTEVRCEQLSQRKETLERLAAGHELNEQINIAIRSSGIPKDRTKQSKPRDAQRPQVGLDGGHGGDCVLPGQRLAFHDRQCTVISTRRQALAREA